MKDRRGDRRSEPARCNELVRAFTGGGPLERCGGELVESPIGEVFCSVCGAVDRRSTEGNRRQARAELERLEARIAADMEAVESRMQGLEELGVALEGRVEKRRQEIYALERKVDDVQDTAERAKREAERAASSGGSRW